MSDEPGMTDLPTRAAWPINFPEVVIHTTVAIRDAHPGYSSAKAGDAVSALKLASDLLDGSGINALRRLLAERPALLLPVVADETTGFNAIPDAMAQVQAGSNYVLVDDHVGLGGTLANLRGFVEARGGTVIAITTLTESRDARRISLRSDTRDVLWQRHGEELDKLWQAQFGHGIDCLTEVEAQQLCRQPSVASIEDFLAKAAIEARGRGLDPAVG